MMLLRSVSLGLVSVASARDAPVVRWMVGRARRRSFGKHSGLASRQSTLLALYCQYISKSSSQEGPRDSLGTRGVQLRVGQEPRSPERGEKVPARRACLSFRPCRISSSSFLVRSSSSLSRRSPSSRMRCKKSFTSSDPSGFVDVVMIPFARCRASTANSRGKWWLLKSAGGGS